MESAVPDVLAPDLRVVFCGINPGRASAAAGAHFANPRNDFWRLLHAAGFTPRLLDPCEQLTVLEHGIGLTNAAYRTTKGSGDLRRGDFEGAAARLEQLARELVPAWIAFVGKEANRGAFGERPQLGVQERRLDATALFVLPSTSPANAAVPWEERLRWFGELAELSRPVPRPAVRALLLDAAGRIFLHRFVGPREPGVWVAPGGALEQGESPEAALRRELAEELRLDAPRLGPWVWRRRHRWYWPALRATLDSVEQFAVVRVDEPTRIAPTAHDSLFAGPDTVEEHRWWSAAEIAASPAKFAPRRLADHLAALLRDGPPPEPVDVGV
ncbi:MAG: NUDIX domain-containing protein [Thermoleophilia bacterium]|nr:NUDIX domain-containing protein [Thermoleophilia bacterium]